MPSTKNNKIKFTLSEKRGIIIFVSLILLFFGVRFCISHFSHPKTNNNHSDFEAQIAAYEESILLEMEKKRLSNFDLLNPNRSFESARLTPFEFDPNTITPEGLKDLGLSAKQTNNILNYRLKGGKFRKKEDFKKMYSISDAEYETLAPYIKITSSGKSSAYNSNQSLIVNLNEADTTELKKLKGIGSVFSKRIVAYRNLLGGFYEKSQLLEVYGFSEDLLKQIEGHIVINSSNIKKINLNMASTDEMKRHPYLDYHQAKAIDAYRNDVKAYDEIEEVLHVNLINTETFNRIKPYLTIE